MLNSFIFFKGFLFVKVLWIRFFFSRVFSRRFSYDYGGFFRGKFLVEDVEEIDYIEEFKRFVDLEKLYEKDNVGFCGVIK